MSIAITAPGVSGSQRRAIFNVCAASFLFVVASAIVKAVAPGIPVFEIALFRCAVGAVVLLPMLRGNGGLAALRTRHPWAHFWRTSAGLVGMLGIYYGYATLPLTTATALGFAMPLCLTLLAIPMLGERVGPGRMVAVLGGLAGVLVMLRPWSLGEAGRDGLPLVPVLSVMASVVAWAFAMISIRRMGAMGERNITIVLYYSLGSAVLLAGLVVPVWVTPHGWTLVGLISVGGISAAAQMLMTAGYRAGEPSLVAPFEYGAVVYTTILGGLIWGEIPDVWTLIGVVMLVAAGTVIWRKV